MVLVILLVALGVCSTSNAKRYDNSAGPLDIPRGHFQEPQPFPRPPVLTRTANHQHMPFDAYHRMVAYHTRRGEQRRTPFARPPLPTPLSTQDAERQARTIADSAGPHAQIPHDTLVTLLTEQLQRESGIRNHSHIVQQALNNAYNPEE